MSVAFRIVHEASDDFGYVGKLHPDGDRVWAVGGTYKKAILLVRAGGGNFERIAVPPVNGLRDLLTLGETLVVCGEPGALFFSKDFGKTWTQRVLETTVCLFTLEKDSRGALWVGGERGFVRKSVDGGETWKPVALGTTTRVNVITQIGSSTYFACHDGTIARLHRDRMERVPIDTGAPICSMIRTKSGALIACGDRGMLHRSDDGKSWTRIDVAGPDLETVCQISDGTIIVVGDKATVLFSNDDGRTFERIECDLGGHLWSVCESSEGALIGGDRGLIAEAQLHRL